MFVGYYVDRSEKQEVSTKIKIRRTRTSLLETVGIFAFGRLMKNRIVMKFKTYINTNQTT